MNIKPDSIVVAVDGSADSDRAVLWAAEQAWLERRPLVAVHVVRDDLPLIGSAAVMPLTSDDLLVAGRAVAEVAAAIATHRRPGVSVEALAVLGEPRRILGEVSRDAHVLVIGSRGRGPVRSRLLGSVSAWVAEHAACPVVVCRPSNPGLVHNGVLAGVDGTAQSLPALEFAFREASLHDQPLTVVHSAWHDQPADRLLSESLAGFTERFPEVHVTRRLDHDLPEESLAADTERWDLVVVGRRADQGTVLPLRRSVSLSVLERSHTTVAVVPDLVADRTA